jgi:hypothetical protein
MATLEIDVFCFFPYFQVNQTRIQPSGLHNSTKSRSDKKSRVDY